MTGNSTSTQYSPRRWSAAESARTWAGRPGTRCRPASPACCTAPSACSAAASPLPRHPPATKQLPNQSIIIQKLPLTPPPYMLRWDVSLFLISTITMKGPSTTTASTCTATDTRTMAKHHLTRTEDISEITIFSNVNVWCKIWNKGLTE